jgi:methionine-gamma-lyase
VRQVKAWRGSLGTQLDPELLLDADALARDARHPHERARMRMAARSPNTSQAHPKIAKVHYLGNLQDGDPRKAVFDRQCSAPGSTFAFDVRGGEKEAFAVLDNLQIMKLAVSLGGTETLVSHPAAMTHSGVARELREEIGLTDALIRISVGIENIEDLISDLAQALEAA